MRPFRKPGALSDHLAFMLVWSLFLVVLSSLFSAVLAADFETGSVELNSTLASPPGSSTWKRVNLQGTYSNPPVVIAGPLTHNNDLSLSVRIRNVTSGSFDIALTSPCLSAGSDSNAAGSPCSPPWATETVHFLVVPPGMWQFPDGTRIEAARQTVSTVRSGLGNQSAGEPVTFQHTYSARPIVLHSVNTTNDPDWITSTAFGPGNDVASPPDTSGFTLALEGAEVTNAHDPESVGWVAIEPSRGMNDGHPYDAGLSSGLVVDRHSDGCFAQGGFTSFTTVPDVVASHNTMEGTNGAWLRFCGNGIETSQINVHMDEDQVGDGERTGLPESISWFAFQAEGLGVLFPSGSITPFFARESFESYGPDSIAGASGGVFWDGPWNGIGVGVESVVDVASSPLSFMNNGDEINGGTRALQFSGNSNTAAVRDLARGISDPVVYAAMLMRFQGHQDANDFVALWFENSGYGAAPNLGIKMNRGSGSIQDEDFFVRTTRNAVYSTNIQEGQTCLVVVKIEKTGSSGYDRASLWVNPTALGNPAGPAPDAQTNVDPSGLNTFDTIGFRSVNLDSGDLVTIDELRLGTSWAEVTAPNVLPVQGQRLQVDTQTNPSFRTVSLNGFDAPPVIFTLGGSTGQGPADIRIRNVTGSSCEVGPVEPSAGNGPHEGLEIDLIALGELQPGERKLYLLDDRDEFAELGRHRTRTFQSKLLGGSGWDSIAFLGRHTQPPAIIADVQTMNNESGNPPQTSSTPWLSTAVQTVTDTGFEMALERSESTTGSVSANETVGYLVISDGVQGSLTDTSGSSVGFAALRSTDSIRGSDDGCFSTGFETTFSDPPLIAAAKNTRDGIDGGWLRRCSLTPSAVGLHVDEDQDHDPDRRHTDEMAGILAMSGFSLSQLDHYVISHDQTAVTCRAEPVTISAADASGGPSAPPSNTVLNLGTNTGKGTWSRILSGSGTLSDPTPGDGSASYIFPGGETSVTLALNYADLQTDPESVDINVSDGTVTEESGSASPDDDLPLLVSLAGFVFTNESDSDLTIPTQIAGKDSDTPPVAKTLALQAVRASDHDPGVCVAAFPPDTDMDVQLGAECRDPVAEAGSRVTIENNGKRAAVVTNDDNGGSLTSSFTPVTLRFGSDARAPIVLNYPDAGQIQLHARYEIVDANGTAPGEFMVGSSNAFVVRPFGFHLDVPGNPGAADASGSVFTTAGKPFTASLSAVVWEAGDDSDADGLPDANGDLADNALAPNFGQETIPEEATLTHTLVAPTGGDPGSLDGTSFAGFTSGACSRSDISWDEVGIVSLKAALKENDYLGSGQDVQGRVPHVGRFIPARFSVDSNIPEFDHGCSGFTYLGQEFGFRTSPLWTVTARDENGLTTSNYGGNFWKLSHNLAGRSYADNTTTASTLAVTTNGTTILTGNGTFDGIGHISLVNEALTYFKPGSPEAPFETRVHLDLSAADLSDTDGVCYDSNADGLCNGYRIPSINGTEQRFGRMMVENAHGSELLPLSDIEIWSEYFDAGSFRFNSADTCSRYNASAIDWGVADFSGSLAAGDLTASGNGTLVNGQGFFSLHQPGSSKDGPGVTGSVDYVFPVVPWLEYSWISTVLGPLDHPAARASFGIYKGRDTVIYQQETTWK